MKTFLNKNIQNILIKTFLLTTIISAIISYPSISTYTSYERYLAETVNKFSTAVEKINFVTLDLSKYEMTLENKDTNNITRKFMLTNLKTSAPVFKKENLSGKMIEDTASFFTNMNKNDTFQMDLNLNLTIVEGENLNPKYIGNGSVRFFVDNNNLNFTLAYDKDFIEYIVKADLGIKLLFSSFSIENCTTELKDIENIINNLLRKNERIQDLQLLISEYIDRSIETYFKNTEQPTYKKFLITELNENVALAIQPVLRPQPQVGKGIINYLEGKPYHENGKKFSGVEYNKDESAEMKILQYFDLYANSSKQVYISNEVFSDLLDVEFHKLSEITIYESDLKNSKVDIPFRFNVNYLNKFMPGLNYRFTNNQKFYVEIKIKDVKYHYGELDDNTEPKNKSFVVISADVFFKTSETNAGLSILDFTVDTKAFFEIIYEKNSSYFNVKFAEDIEIIQLLPKSYISLSFYNDLFKEEFAKSFAITNLGEFDYRLFRNPISMNDLLSENYQIIPMLKGVLLFDTPNVNLKEDKDFENKERKNLEFLK